MDKKNPQKYNPDKSTVNTYVSYTRNSTYGYVFNKGFLIDSASGVNGKSYGKKCVTGDIIEMILNCTSKKWTLSYKINNKSQGIAYTNIEKTKYRVAIIIGEKGQHLRFLKYEPIF